MNDLRKKKLYVLMDVLCVFVGKLWTLSANLFVSTICFFFFFLSRNCASVLSARTRSDLRGVVSSFSPVDRFAFEPVTATQESL